MYVESKERILHNHLIVIKKERETKFELKPELHSTCLTKVFLFLTRAYNQRARERERENY